MSAIRLDRVEVALTVIVLAGFAVRLDHLLTWWLA